MKDAQAPCSHSVRCLRYPQSVRKAPYPIRGEISCSRNVNRAQAWPATDTLRFY